MSEENKKRPFKEYIRIYFTGVIMGAADVVPGVSGGTMAFILGIYEELIESIRSFTAPAAIKLGVTFQVKKAYQTLPWPFLLALGLGVLTSIATLSSQIKYLLENQPVLIWAFFFGLVLASIFAVFPKVRKWNAAAIVSALVGTALGWIVVGLPLLANPPDSYLYLALCGALAICAMILPGISGSFILVLLGKYKMVLDAVHNLKSGIEIGENLTILIIFCIGIVIGISSFVRLLSWLFKHFHDITVAVLIGFMVGSLRKVWPWKESLADDAGNVMPTVFNGEFYGAIGLALAGFILVITLEQIAKHLEKKQAQAAQGQQD